MKMKEEEEERERKIGFGGESAMEAVMFGFGTFALVTRLRHAFFLGVSLFRVVQSIQPVVQRNM